METKNILKDRATFLANCKDKRSQDMAYELCRKSPVTFINLLCYTYDPRQKNPHRPFVLYEFQEDLVESLVGHIDSGNDMLVEKSRDMGVTWVVLAVGLWGWLFMGWDGKVGSRNENYVDTQGDMDSLFEKMRYMVSKLPKWILPKGFKLSEHATYMKLLNPETKVSIVGEAPTAFFGTGGRRKWALLDEFAYWPHGESSWRKLGDTTPCRIAVSTPEGRHNTFAKLRHDSHIDVHTLHWKLHPLKDEEWYNEQKNRRTAEEIAQELDISYEASVTGRVYKEFDEVEHGGDERFDYTDELPVFTSWDFGEGGQDPTSIIWLQIHPHTKHIRVIDALEKNTGDLSWFAPFVLRQHPSASQVHKYTEREMEMIERHKEWKVPQHWGDPYNGDKTMLQTSIKKELEKHGVYINLGKRSTVEERIRKVRLAMKNMVVHERCHDTFSQAIQNARYPQVRETSQATSAKTKPIHDWTSHFRTALEYAVDNIVDNTRFKTKGRLNLRKYKPLS